jgi:hypothetical protein
MPKKAGWRIVGKGNKPEGRYQNYDDGLPGLHAHMRYRMICKECLEKYPPKKEQEDESPAPF